SKLHPAVTVNNIKNFIPITLEMEKTHRSLPPFYEARSKLILEETRKAKQATIAAITAGTALITTTTSNNNTKQVATETHDSTRASHGNGTFNGCGHGGRTGSHGHGNRGGHGRGRGGWSWPTGLSAGILRPCPSQAYAASVAPSTLTYAPELESAMHTMTLNPLDKNWYMDTGASSHMTGSQGTLSSYSHMSIPKHIIVGNGHAIPIQGLGNKILSPPHPPLKLNKVLHAPHLIKNLISVRRLSTDNNISITFDLFGFTLKDFLMGIQLMRCDSNGDLYPLTTTALQQLQPPSTFAVFSQDL
nr:hypothetical protein [Tanacetum cinerariifolium]